MEKKERKGIEKLFEGKKGKERRMVELPGYQLFRLDRTGKGLRYYSTERNIEFLIKEMIANKILLPTRINIYEQDITLTLEVLCLPHFNADIERVFSQMNSLIKFKLRNKIKLPLLNNLLHIRFGLKRLDLYCNNYILPEHVLKNIGNNKTYKKLIPELDPFEAEELHLILL
ncbi:hypothetical protein ALC57_07911 [Trachymyrmex cornetzi]|uniref:Uncharacterized protein n=1 Tax=Trachymyrmex cornetzi TaxID=471704 RepID=A0A151J7E6_9HYME|nr:hypothetical protein ALC57_07911 [Trachymyrmex cornetzi]